MQPITQSLYSGAGATLTDVVNVIKAGAESWNDTCGILLTYTSDPASADIVIGSDNQPGGQVGLGGYSSAASTAGGDTGANSYWIVAGFVQIDNSEGGSFWTANKLRSTVAHEIGHAIGLTHTGPTATVDALMEPSINSNVGPAPDDRWYAQFLYGAAPAKLSASSAQTDSVDLTIGRASPLQVGTNSDDTTGGSMGTASGAHGPGTGTGLLQHQSVSKYILERKKQGDPSFTIIDNNVQAPTTNDADGDLSHTANAFTYTDNGPFENGATYIYRVKANYVSSGDDLIYSDEASVTVTVTIPPPVITTISPSTRVRPQTNLDLTFTGSNFHLRATNPVTFSGTGITVVNVTEDSDTQLTVRINIASNAPIGGRTVQVFNDDNGTSSKANGFTVEAPAPTVTNTSPSLLLPGFTGNLTITGTNFHTEGGNPAAVFSLPTGVTVNSVTVNSPTQLTLAVTVAANAAMGTRNLTVTNPDTKSGVQNNAIRVHAVPIAIIAAEGQSDSLVIGEGEDVDFDGSGSSDPDTTNTIANYAWDFGDGNTSPTNATAAISHTYTDPGAYFATLVVTDDEGVQSVAASLLISVAGGADDADLYASSGNFSISRTKLNADAFMIRGNFNPMDLPANLAGVRAILTLNGSDVATAILDAAGRFSSVKGVVPGVKAQVTLKSKMFLMQLKAADLLAELGPTDQTGVEQLDVAVGLRFTNGAATTYLELNGLIRFDVTSRLGVSSKGKFAAAKNMSFGGFFVVTKGSAKEDTRNGLGHLLSLSGFIHPAGGAALDLSGDVTVDLGGATGIVIPDAVFLTSGAGTTATFTMNAKDAAKPAELKSFQLANAKKTFKLSTNYVAGTGVPNAGAGGLTFPLDVDFVIVTPSGNLTFSTTYLLTRTAVTGTSWK